MGDGEKTPLTPKFASSFGVLLSPQTLDYLQDDALGLTDSSAENLKEGRTGKNILHKLIPLLRPICLAGTTTPMMPITFPRPSRRWLDRKAASTSEMSSETELLTQKVKGLSSCRMGKTWRSQDSTGVLSWTSTVQKVHGGAPTMDTSSACANPLFCFNLL